jgi:hypothetical protein
MPLKPLKRQSKKWAAKLRSSDRNNSFIHSIGILNLGISITSCPTGGFLFQEQQINIKLTKKRPRYAESLGADYARSLALFRPWWSPHSSHKLKIPLGIKKPNQLRRLLHWPLNHHPVGSAHTQQKFNAINCPLKSKGGGCCL